MYCILAIEERERECVCVYAHILIYSFGLELRVVQIGSIQS